MSIWGKIIGATAGLALGGPIGALIGGVGGHFIDKIRQEERANTAQADNHHDGRNMAFTIGVVVLGAKMAKADGHVTKDEIAAFKTVFQIPPDELESVGTLFNQAKQDSAGYEPYAYQIAHMFKDSPEILEELLWSLTYIAKADGIIHPNEVHYLETIARIFGLDRAAFERITALHDTQAGDSDYKILGVQPEDDFETIKQAHRKLVRTHHPDHLIAKGMPEEFIEQANDKMARINAAFDNIKKQRGI